MKTLNQINLENIIQHELDPFDTIIMLYDNIINYMHNDTQDEVDLLVFEIIDRIINERN